MNSFLLRSNKLLFLFLITVGIFNQMDAKPAYEWTTDHMHVGVRWQPSVSRPLNNAYELTRPILAEHSSYVMFWVAWPQIEPNAQNCDYQKYPSGGLKMFDRSLIVDPNLSPKSRKPSLQVRILRKLGFNLQPKTHKYGRYKWLKEEEL